MDPRRLQKLEKLFDWWIKPSSLLNDEEQEAAKLSSGFMIVSCLFAMILNLTNQSVANQPVLITSPYTFTWLWLGFMAFIYPVSRTHHYKIAANLFTASGITLLIVIYLGGFGPNQSFVTIGFFLVISIYIVSILNYHSSLLWISVVVATVYWVGVDSKLTILARINSIAVLLMVTTLTLLLNRLRRKSYQKRLRIEAQLTEQRLSIEYLHKTESANKLMLLGEISSGIAHEIKNPLTAIAGKALVIRTRAKAKKLTHDECIRHTDQILKTVDMVNKIITNVQKMAHTSDSAQKEVRPLEEIAQTAMEMTKEKAKQHQVEVIYNHDDFNFDIPCNEIQLTQVLINLISNAIDAVKNLDQKWVRLISEKNEAKNTFTLKIVDSGPGIPRDIQRKIMTPFFTTKEKGEGTGMGLNFCRRIVEGHHGEFGIEAANENTCFYITLPLDETLAISPKAG